jgi:hypothetical protein
MQNSLPGTQSTFIPKLGTAQECVISSEQAISLNTVLLGKTSIPVDLNNLSGSSIKIFLPFAISKVEALGSTPCDVIQ